MQKIITIYSEKKTIELDVNTIIYVRMLKNVATVHVYDGTVYKTRVTLAELKKELGDGFVMIHRGILVNAMAIHHMDSEVHLINGEALRYAECNAKRIENQIYKEQKRIIEGYHESEGLKTAEEYHTHYQSFDSMPFAFADIELVFNEKNQAMDWIFCYGNEALAKLEKMPLEKLIGSSFGSLFVNMDSKWVRSYERSAIFGEMLEIIDHSPEIDTYLDVICFPTFKGHCGCILFDISKVKFAGERTPSQQALALYFTKMMSARTV